MADTRTASPAAGTLLDIARGAYRQQEHDHETQRRSADEERAEQQREADTMAIRRAARQSQLAAWFPGIAWALVDRNAGTGSIVVQDPESGLMFRVIPAETAGGTWRVDLVRPADPPARFGRYVSVRTHLRGAADVGRWLADQERVCEAAAPAEGDR